MSITITEDQFLHQLECERRNIPCCDSCGRQLSQIDIDMQNIWCMRCEEIEYDLSADNDE